MNNARTSMKYGNFCEIITCAPDRTGLVGYECARVCGWVAAGSHNFRGRMLNTKRRTVPVINLNKVMVVHSWLALTHRGVARSPGGSTRQNKQMCHSNSRRLNVPRQNVIASMPKHDGRLRLLSGACMRIGCGSHRVFHYYLWWLRRVVSAVRIEHEIRYSQTFRTTKVLSPVWQLCGLTNRRVFSSFVVACRPRCGGCRP